ncbi:hypothetical protein NP233_g2330 [Leucocoprinus birnbaumii]|uniref:60S ribosomal protein L38 n=1 Tax=Leucocoprinus birnbaumii TaxID=56174 RepID=A0AAD5YV09_9AGAR|nr:hypothetical protein NP233_g2330 [Leucocoprinus birnbaumii]
MREQGRKKGRKGENHMTRHPIGPITAMARRSPDNIHDQKIRFKPPVQECVGQGYRAPKPPSRLSTMPKEIRDIKEFIKITQRKDASQARIKKIPSKVQNGKTKTKFKVRCSRYLYTLSVDDPEKAEKLQQSLPPGLTIVEVDKPKKK